LLGRLALTLMWWHSQVIFRLSNAERIFFRTHPWFLFYILRIMIMWTDKG
jgi:hypothetical protein